MALESTSTPFLKTNSLETQTKFNEDLGREITWHLISVDLNDIGLNQLNNRFAPDEAMTEDEHEKAIIEEDSIAFENLQKSWSCNPQFEQLIGYTDDGTTKINLIAGHRRFFAAKRTKSKSALIWVAHGLTADEVEHVRDWPEIHQTKVPHASFSRYKAIYNDLKGRNELDREKRMNVWKQKGYTKPQILKAERVFGRMDSFCKSVGEKTQQRSGQVKAFETYDQICETKFQELRDQGEIGRIVTLDKVAKAFLKNQIAHDDLKVTVEGLSDLPPSDPVYKSIQENPDYLNDVQNLRRLTNLARTQRNTENVVTEVKEFSGRIFAKLVDRADIAEMTESLSEFKDTVARLEAALSNINTRGAK